MVLVRTVTAPAAVLQGEGRKDRRVVGGEGYWPGTWWGVGGRVGGGGWVMGGEGWGGGVDQGVFA